MAAVRWKLQSFRNEVLLDPESANTVELAVLTASVPVRKLIRPTLAKGYIIPALHPAPETEPDHAETGLVTNQILLSHEQADLLVADLTGNNPNVLYELGIYHAFGEASIMVREETNRPNNRPPFDVQAYRYQSHRLLPMGLVTAITKQ